MNSKKLSKSPKKIVRCVKLSPPIVIKWCLKDNLCLLYAIREMCSPIQKGLLIVSLQSIFVLLLFSLTLKMEGKLPFVESFKISMNLLTSQNILKGISAADVNLHLRWIATRYE